MTVSLPRQSDEPRHSVVVVSYNMNRELPAGVSIHRVPDPNPSPVRAPNRRLGRADEELLEDVPQRQVVFTITEQVVTNLLSWRHSGPFPAEARWDVLGFLARVIDHIPELPAQETEPLAHAPPETLELIAESARASASRACSQAPAQVRLTSRPPAPGSIRVQGGHAAFARSNRHLSSPSAPFFRLNTLAARKPISYSSSVLDEWSEPIIEGSVDYLGSGVLSRGLNLTSAGEWYCPISEQRSVMDRIGCAVCMWCLL